MYKIFINNVPVFLINENANNIMPNQNKDVLFVTYLSIRDLLNIIKHIEKNPDLKQVFIFRNEVEQVKNDFFSIYKQIISAGGLVCTPQNDILLINRYKKWDLPKGKIEKNETIEIAAVREVEEETAILGVKLIAPIKMEFNNAVTYHTYLNGKERILKTTYWFNMLCSEKKEGTPQKEEGIEEVKWVFSDNLPNYYPTMYASIKDVISSWLKYKNN